MNARLPSVVLLAAVLAACTGETGPIGPQGPPGENGQPGQDGQPGATTGTITVLVTDAATGDPIVGADVYSDPAGLQCATGPDGTCKATLTIGVYTVATSAVGFKPADTQVVSLVVGGSVELEFTLDPDVPAPPPVAASAGPDRFQAGFGAVVTLDASASTGPAGATLSYAWTQVGGPQVVLSDLNAAAPTFTTRTIAELEPAFSAPFRAALSRFGVLGFSEADVAAAAYTFQVTVSDGATEATDEVIVRSVAGQPGLSVVAVDTVTVLNSNLAGPWAWTCQVGTPAVDCAAGTLTAGTTKHPAFRAPAEGLYTVSDGTSTVQLLASRYVGARPVDGTTTCSSCHDIGDASRLDTYSYWTRTKHSTYFERAITGRLTSSTGVPFVYREECIRCHTVGYNPDAASGGFDDVAAQVGWTFPPRPNSLAWINMPPALQSVASVACENCHGPGSQHVAAPSPATIGRSFAATDCSQCHAKEPYEVQGLQWRESAHALFVTGTRPAAGDPALAGTDCAACHSAQGFAAWAKDGAREGRAPTAPPPAADVAEPQTCAACHDPHGRAISFIGQEHFRQLRIWDYVVTLVPGLGTWGGGSGALCLTCHNGGRTFVRATQAAPHRSSQGDVLFGVGAQPLGGGAYPSSMHATVPGLCVGCHMAPTPPPGSPGHNLVGGHTVAVRNGTLQHLAACTGCHAGLTSFDRLSIRDYDGDNLVRGVQTEVRGLLTLVKRQLAGEATALWPAQVGAAPEVVAYAGVIRIFKIDGAAGCDLAVPNLPEACFAFPAGFIPQGTAAEQRFLDAAWNYFLVEGERSRGIHNAAYTVSVLQRAYLALGGSLPPSSIRQ